MSGFNKYNFLVNVRNGDMFEATDFYLYPVEANDYAELNRNYTYDKYPVMAFIYLTNRCDDNCNGCFARSIEDGQAQLCWEVTEKLLRDLAAHGTKAVKLAGREPTSSPDLSKCVRLCGELGMKSIVISSGARIDIHKEALSQYCTHLRLSLNTVSQELHEQIHHPSPGALKFNDRTAIARKIIAERRMRGLVTGATYLVRSPEDSLGYEYALMCRDMGFDYVRFTVLDSQKGKWEKGWSQMYARLLTTEREDFKVNIHSPIKGRDIPVANRDLIDPAIISRVVVHANGKVNACQEGWRGKWDEPRMATFGNINEQSFHEIWLGERRKHFLDFIKQTHEDGMKQCGTCIEGNRVCAGNCKYSGFNLLQKWIISEIEKDRQADFRPILLEQSWGMG